MMSLYYGLKKKVHFVYKTTKLLLSFNFFVVVQKICIKATKNCLGKANKAAQSKQWYDRHTYLREQKRLQIFSHSNSCLQNEPQHVALRQKLKNILPCGKINLAYISSFAFFEEAKVLKALAENSFHGHITHSIQYSMKVMLAICEFH